MFYFLTENNEGIPSKIEIKGRIIHIPKAYKKIARFHFKDIIEQPLSAQDYLVITENFSAILIDNIVSLKSDQKNEARRLITLIDVLYENRSLLAISADAEPEKLYESNHGVESKEYRRTISRLSEMRTQIYLDDFCPVSQIWLSHTLRDIAFCFHLIKSVLTKTLQICSYGWIISSSTHTHCTF